MSGGQHSRERGGYVTAWCGDLNADLPTITFVRPYPEPELPKAVDGPPSPALLRWVLDGLRKL